MMKKLVIVFMTFLLMISNVASVFADERQDFNLIEYLEENDISSNAEFIRLLVSHNCCSAMTLYTESLTSVNDLNNEEISFSYEIDYQKQTIEVDTVYLTNALSNSVSGRATHDTYSVNGKLVYTVTVIGSFSVNAQMVTCYSKSGSFVPGVGSSWTSTPLFSSGNYSSLRAYARTYGVASSSSQVNNYQLTLVCDATGTLSSTFAGV